YGTNSEFGFDYLRDNMKTRLEDQVQGRLDFAIVDEVDSILIDEARTPLIISGPAHGDVSRYKWSDGLARSLVRRQGQLNGETAQRLAQWGDNPPQELLVNQKFDDARKRFRVDPEMLTEDEAEAILHRQLYVVQRDRKQVHLTHEGVAHAQEEASIGSFYSGANMECPHLIENALRAHVVYERDKEYVVQDRSIIIVDEFTGRLMHGRQWSDGLHQAVEAKENVPVKEETQTMATITIQNFFKLYEKIAGMTGTAMTETEEFMKIYKLEVIAIPTNRPVNREDHNDRIYRTFTQKYDMIVEEINEVRRHGRPNDPFLLADVFRRYRPILQQSIAEGREKDGPAKLERLDEAVRQFNAAELGDKKVIAFMMETYDIVMGELAMGRPILVGTTSVENSERLSKLLERKYGVEHEVLNAKNHAREAEIVAKAGQRSIPERGDKTPLGNVTIATNMAGRGTDIKLEPGVVYNTCKVPLNVLQNKPDYPARSLAMYPVGTTKCCIHCEEYNPATNCAHCFKPKLDPRFPELGRKVCSLNSPCGLHIIGTERHEARRIDNQLRGRSGRQGDPGSSRFFLSLEDDLLKLFMPDWMLKMMEKLGFTEGMSLEDKRISKGIERAQKKVEERNFSIRKHLLEWDEPMDFQRRNFYSERQQILEGKHLDQLIWRMLDQEIDMFVDDYLASNYASRRISDWCKNTLDIPIPASALATHEPEFLQHRIREKAIDEAQDAIRTSLGEYIDEEAPSSEWDVGGLLKWAERMFHHVNVSQNQLRKMQPNEIQELLIEAANRYYEEVDLTPIEVYLDPQYPRSSLADWARAKFSIDVKGDEIAKGSANDVKELLREKMRNAYERREVNYPAEAVITQAFNSSGTDNVFALQQIVAWANAKYRTNWTTDRLVNMGIDSIMHELIVARNEFLDHRLDQEIDAALSQHAESTNGGLAEWAQQRFGRTIDAEALMQPGADQRGMLQEAGQQLVRWELTQLEKYVLLRIYDQCWKDHLLEMDHLKNAIMQRPLGGDQSHPQSQYAIEGRELFEQMWNTIRDHVTDMIFKVSAHSWDSENAPSRTVNTNLQARHDSSAGAGFAGASADQQAGLQAQGEGAKPATIRRQVPRVGRNDPCPCGSGKKYKQCCGK
ncbi:MAG: SEC-C metal-binding domain-containing protein, partial [Phycisphaerae bacterium]|nr:SEC-C metal-binding domain-containing protein [Phycisphaerae bacterium]